MKKTTTGLRHRAGLTLGMAVAVVLAFLSACTGEKSADLADLMGKVPSDVAGVMAYDAKSLLEKSGSKVSDGKVETSDDMQKAIAGIKDPKTRALVKGIFNGESGVAIGATVIFTEGYVTYMSALVDNPDKLESFAEELTGEKFAVEQDVHICGTVAYKGNQCWLVLSGASAINAQEVRRFAALDATQSFMSTPGGKFFEGFRHDLIGWGNVQALFNVSGGGFGDAAMLRMGMSAVFDDLTYAEGWFDFEKGALKGEVAFLNSDAKPSKFLLPFEKMKAEAFTELGGQAGAVIGFAANKKLVEKLEKLSKTFGGALPDSYLSALGSLDGTVALALGDAPQSGAVVVTTTGEGTTPLSDMITQFAGATVVKEGNYLKASKGTPEGPITVADCGPLMKGNMIGMVWSGQYASKQGNPDGSQIKQASVMFAPGDGSVVLKFNVESVDQKANILATALRFAVK